MDVRRPLPGFETHPFRPLRPTGATSSIDPQPAGIRARYVIVMTPRIAALVEAFHQPGARADLAGLFRRFDSELLV